MEVSKLIISSLGALILITVLRQLNKEYAVLASCLVSVSLMVCAVGLLSPVFDYIKTLEQNLGESKSFISLMFKCTGVGLLCAFGAEICRDSGESALGAKIELVGKCTMTALCLPLIKTVLGYAEKFIG